MNWLNGSVFTPHHSMCLYYVKVILKCKTMEMLFCGSPTLVINVLVNILGWEDGTRSMN